MCLHPTPNFIDIAVMRHFLEFIFSVFVFFFASLERRRREHIYRKFSDLVGGDFATNILHMKNLLLLNYLYSPTTHKNN